MSKPKKFFIAVLALLLIAIIGLQVFLRFALTNTLAKHVVPVAEELTGLKIHIDSASVSLLGGSAKLSGLTVGNPEGFVEKRMAGAQRVTLSVGIPAFIRRGTAEIRKLTARDVTVSIIRNLNNEINILEILERFEEKQPEPAERDAGEDSQVSDNQSASQSEQLEENAPVEEGEVEKSFPFMLRRGSLNVAIKYIDHYISPDNPFTLALQADVKIKNLSSRQSDRQPPGKIDMQGVFSVDKTKTAFMLNGIIDPLTVPEQLTFDLDGTIEKITLDAVRPYIENSSLDISSGAVSGTFKVICVKGVFDSDKSVCNLVFHDITLSEERQRRMGGVALPDKIEIPVHISGTIMEPAVDKNAIANAILSATLRGIGAKNIPVDADLIKEGASDPSKSIRGFLKGLKQPDDSHAD